MQTIFCVKTELSGFTKDLLKRIKQRTFLKFALVKLLVIAPLFNAQRKHVLNQVVICAGHYDLAASVFFNMRIVSEPRT